jgi:HK97 gp10 family phage protein
MGSSVVIGGAALRAALAQLGDDVDDAAIEVVLIAAGQAQDEWQQRAPVDTGAYRAHIDIRLSDGGFTAEVGVFDVAIDYEEYVEFGTSSMPAQPAMTPTVEDERVRLPRLAAALIGKALA